MSCRIFWKSIGGAVLSCLLITSSVGRASADIGESIVGGALLLGLGCATGAINCGNKKKSSRATAPQPRSNINSAARQQNREVQTALNGFGWNVGSVDGVLGKNSRAAIQNYQGYMDFPQTGKLTDWERQNLVDGWQRIQAGAGGAYPRTMAAEGPRGMLRIGRDPNYAARYGDSVTPNYAANQGETVNSWPENGTQNAATQPYNEPQQPQGGQVIEANTAAPKLKPIGTVAVSAAARCELVDQTTRIQGGVILASNMTNPDQALSEKFCEARGFAITRGGAVAAQYAVSENELTEFCKQIATEYSSIFSDLGAEHPDQTVSMVQSTAAQMGLNDAATMGQFGQICIGIGYRLDGAEVALAGALTMLAASQQPYAELVGHHLREGFGVNPAPLDATQWYLNAMDALENGAEPAFVPSTTTERIQVIRAALLQMQSQRANGNVQSQPKVVPTANNLPTLTLKE